MKSAAEILMTLAFAATAAQAEPSVEQMRNQRRVLILAAPTADDARLIQQQRFLADWVAGAKDRDVSVVEAIGSVVRGSGDTGAMLRRKWRLPAGRFTLILVGKDGHEAVRSQEPLTGAAISARIDAMPMRRAGER